MVTLISCQKRDSSYLFVLLDNSQIGINFVNQVENTSEFNIFNYRNFYNGGGVAIGDINNDGLADIYFTANMGSNKLYLNKGNFQFEDITEKANVALEKSWSTGVVMADINADGLLDIYVCNAGLNQDSGQNNSLFINNGDFTFTERALEYGLADGGYTTHAAFFDYDLDGDLDAYILNNSFIPVNTLNNANNRDLRAEEWPVKDYLKGGGDKLLRNDGNFDTNGKFVAKYVDVSEEAGIYGSLIGFGLGVTIGDLNEDNYPDIYVSNDFYEKDYLYINQQNGSFKEEIENRIGHTSFASMGADMADINNDGLQELFVTDMLPRDEQRLKTTTAFDSHYSYQLRLEKGFYHQYMQNTLQLNKGNGQFAEIASYAGVEASDWSWGALLFDADNDGRNDIYISNGIQHDVIDQDFIDFFANELNKNMLKSGKKEGIEKILSEIPSKPLRNLFFKNEGNLKFTENSKDWMKEMPSFSNGAAYADLDNDGDLDLVVNNVNSQAFMYKNNTNASNNFLKFQLIYGGANTHAVGAQINIYNETEILSKQLIPSRGFQSSTEYPLTFGIGKWNEVDSVQIIWPNRKAQILKGTLLNSLIKIQYEESKVNFLPTKTEDKLLFESVKFDFEKHQENNYEDYYYEKNIPFKLSNEGPKMAIADVNGDNLDDVFICGAKNQASQLYLQTNNGFKKVEQEVFKIFGPFEDTACSFFDADGDGDKDLYIGAGGNEAEPETRELFDRLYLNDGKGNFSYALMAIPGNAFNTAVIAPYDYDNDGDVDLFVGSRSYPKAYGMSPPSFLYRNDGEGTFTDVSKSIAPVLSNVGMVQAATWCDIDGDKRKELVIAGDWMAPQVLTFNGKAFVPKASGLEGLFGFWGAIESADIDQDGDLDLILGNIGENFAINVDQEHPLKIFIADFDNNGVVDKVFAKTVAQKEVPVFLKRETMDQFPALKSKSLKHASFAQKELKDLFDSNALKSAEQHQVNFLKSIIAVNNGDGTFKVVELPTEVQYACIKAIKCVDINNDGKLDMLLAGNYKNMIPQFNTLDACLGIVLQNMGNGSFKNSKNKGFEMKGQAKDLQSLRFAGRKYIIGTENNDYPKVFRLNE